ncbi:MAG: hypothetical protein IKW91_01205 [Bacteroidaceae bacterium]|nr:hypothetical protein [Bacteroidaceae bacterium]
MAKKIRSVWQLLLGSLITLLGFAACKSSKKAQQGDGTLVLYGPPPVQVEKEPIDKVRLLYGVPPIKVEKVPEVK